MNSHTREAFGNFPRTTGIWPLVHQARDDAARREALQHLLVKYLPPLKAHLVVRRRIASDHADDLLQSFIASKVLASGLFDAADRSRGRFRSFLLTALDRFLIDQSRQRQDLLQLAADLPVEVAAESADSPPFNAAWARLLIEDAAEAMRRECHVGNRPELWGILEARLIRPCLEHVEAASYQSLVQQYALESPAQASNLLMTAKRMFRRCLEAVVAEYAGSEQAVKEELESLGELLGPARS